MCAQVSCGSRISWIQRVCAGGSVDFAHESVRRLTILEEPVKNARRIATSALAAGALSLSLLAPGLASAQVGPVSVPGTGGAGTNTGLGVGIGTGVPAPSGVPASGSGVTGPGRAPVGS